MDASTISPLTTFGCFKGPCQDVLCVSAPLRFNAVPPLFQNSILLLQSPSEATGTHGPANQVVSRRWNDFGRVNVSMPSWESVQPRPESFTPVQASAGSR